jgi:phage baseplate assembly protein W
MAKTPLGLTLPLRRGASGMFETTTDVLTQVKTNLINLLLTRRGERPFQPDFGCDVYNSLFEQQSDDAMAEIEASIKSAVATWLPFLSINSVQTTRDNNTVTIQVSFSLVNNPRLTDTIKLEF